MKADLTTHILGLSVRVGQCVCVCVCGCVCVGSWNASWYGAGHAFAGWSIRNSLSLLTVCEARLAVMTLVCLFVCLSALCGVPGCRVGPHDIRQHCESGQPTNNSNPQEGDLSYIRRHGHGCLDNPQRRLCFHCCLFVYVSAGLLQKVLNWLPWL